MPKEKSYNPVAAQRKADKAKAIKKGKSEAQERRNERLARKNPDQLQRQIDDLKKITDGGGKLSRHEEQVLEGLEKEIKAVKKARDALGDKAPAFGRGWARDGGGGVLGKRRRGSAASSSEDDDVPDDVQRIPMPRDTPPPIPKEVLDAWFAKRRARRAAEQTARSVGGVDNAGGGEKDTTKKRPPEVESRTVYEAAPVTRDLHREAVAAFVPSAVRSKLAKGAGRGGLMEPEEADALEAQGYIAKASEEQATEEEPASRNVTVEDAEDDE